MDCFPESSGLYDTSLPDSLNLRRLVPDHARSQAADLPRRFVIASECHREGFARIAARMDQSNRKALSDLIAALDGAADKAGADGDTRLLVRQLLRVPFLESLAAGD
jgi:hypothetical protein